MPYSNNLQDITMLVLLINPPTLDIMPNKEYIIPSSLLYLAAVLKADNTDVMILDLNIYEPWTQDVDTVIYCSNIIIDIIKQYNPSLIGFGCLFSGLFPIIRDFSEIIRNNGCNVPIVVGGMHPTVFPEEILTHCPSIDYIAIGEGEKQIVALARSIKNGTPEILSRVDGIAFHLDDKIHISKKQKYIEDLDSIPFPAYDLIDFADYHHFTAHWHNPKGLKFNMTVPLISSRSCPNHCNFCSMYLVMGPKIRMRSIENVVDEIQLLYEHYGQTHFSFMDDNVNLVRKHIIGICREITKRKLDIQFETPNGLSINSLNKEVMDVMVEAGWIRGAIAIESGSDYIRNNVMGKHLNKKKIFEVVELAKSYRQLYLKAYFIIGMPEETVETLNESFEMIESLGLPEVYVTNLMPFPGTDVFKQAIKDHLFIADVDVNDMWNMVGFHYHDNFKFYIKPYKMTIDELNDARVKFNHLLIEMREKCKMEYGNGKK